MDARLNPPKTPLLDALAKEVVKAQAALDRAFLEHYVHGPTPIWSDPPPVTLDSFQATLVIPDWEVYPKPKPE